MRVQQGSTISKITGGFVKVVNELDETDVQRLRDEGLIPESDQTAQQIHAHLRREVRIMTIYDILQEPGALTDDQKTALVTEIRTLASQRPQKA